MVCMHASDKSAVLSHLYAILHPWVRDCQPHI